MYHNKCLRLGLFKKLEKQVRISNALISVKNWLYIMWNVYLKISIKYLLVKNFCGVELCLLTRKKKLRMFQNIKKYI